MSGEIKKICNNCDNLQYGFGESSMNYGPRCFEKDCGVDENDTCDMFEIASYLKVKKLQEQNKILREALGFYADNSNWLGNGEIGYSDRLLAENKAKTNFLEFGGKLAREALAKVSK